MARHQARHPSSIRSMANDSSSIPPSCCPAAPDHAVSARAIEAERPLVIPGAGEPAPGVPRSRMMPLAVPAGATDAAALVFGMDPEPIDLVDGGLHQAGDRPVRFETNISAQCSGY